jgi:TatD DNase family protein
MIFYDTHAHLDGPAFAHDLPQVIERAHAAGIARIITIGTDLASSERALRISEQYPNVYAAVGWHPNDAASAPEDVRPVLRSLASHPRVVAIGEIGLDYYRLPGNKSEAKRHRAEGRGQSAETDHVGVGLPEPPERTNLIRKQKGLFRQQLELAAELGLNCVIHQREALEDTWELFHPWAAKVWAVFHCFANDSATMQRIVDVGSRVSFTGIVTFPNGQNVRAALAATPMGQFMLETDSPYLAPVPHRGTRCEPAFIPYIAAAAAEVCQCSLEELSAATCASADAFFKRRSPESLL